MKTLTKFIMALFIANAIVGYTFAQSTEEPEPNTTSIQVLVEALRVDTIKYELLSKEIANAGKMKHKSLTFRRHERALDLLTDFDTLVARVTRLPDGSPLKKKAEAPLIESAELITKALFHRINEIQQQIIEANTRLDDLSGSSLVAAQAYIQSMETLRVVCYKAFIDLMDSRKALGLQPEHILDRLSPKLYLYAETIAGRIEASAATSSEAQSLAASDPNNADIKTALKSLAAIHDLNVKRLKTTIQVLDRLGLNSTDYKAVMLQESKSLSISFFSGKAFLSILKESIASLKNSLKDNAPDIFFRMVLFIVVLQLFRAFSRITKRGVRAACDRSTLDLSELLKDIFVSTSGGIIMVVGVLLALQQVGISLAPMLAGLGVAGFIIGFALQDTLSNFAAGAMILIYRPYDVDDFVDVAGATGLVKKMNLVSTTIITFDNQTLVVPNSKIWGDVIKNVTAQKVRRVDMVFGIGYGEDVEKAERVLEDILNSHELVLKKPKPMVRLHTLADSSVDFVVRPWVKTADYWDVYYDITREVKMRFDQEGIPIPFPQRDVHLYQEQV